METRKIIKIFQIVYLSVALLCFCISQKAYSSENAATAIIYSSEMANVLFVTSVACLLRVQVYLADTHRYHFKLQALLQDLKKPGSTHYPIATLENWNPGTFCIKHDKKTLPSDYHPDRKQCCVDTDKYQDIIGSIIDSIHYLSPCNTTIYLYPVIDKASADKGGTCTWDLTSEGESASDSDSDSEGEDGSGGSGSEIDVENVPVQTNTVRQTFNPGPDEQNGDYHRYACANSNGHTLDRGFLNEVLGAIREILSERNQSSPDSEANGSSE